MTSNGLTTEPATRKSMRSRPPAISLTRVTYCSAISLKMSLAPQAPCILSTIGDCATEIIGAVSAAAPATPAAAEPRKRRRAGLAGAGATFVGELDSVMFVSWLGACWRCSPPPPRIA